MRSLRARLFVYLVGGASVVLVAGGLTLRAIVVNALQVEFDVALSAKARSLVALTEQEGGQIEFHRLCESRQVGEAQYGFAVEAPHVCEHLAVGRVQCLE